MTGRVLVAGVGNIFLGDDGFGVEVARRLAFTEVPDGVRVAGSKCGVLQRAADADKHPGQRANRWRSKGIARRGHGAGQSRRPAPLKSLDASGTSSGFTKRRAPLDARE